MTQRKWTLIGGGVVALGLLAAVARTAQERQPRPDRFEFEVIECFDAKYLGDTPGHIGRNGGLEARAPLASLGSPVFRGETKIGTITGLVWDHGRGSLEVEFDPEPFVPIRVGETVWIELGDPVASAPRP
jgi:hypothetical protein